MRDIKKVKCPRNAPTLIAIDIHVLADIPRALWEALQHDTITLCANSRGPAGGKRFRASFRKEQQGLRAELVQPGLMFQRFRHNAVTLLVEAGVSVEDGAAVLRWRSSKVAEHRSRDVVVI